MASTIRGADTLIQQEDWESALQEQLDEPTKWKEFANVVFTNFQTINNPYHTDPSVSTYQPGTPYTFAAMVQTNESISLTNHRIIAQPIDRADLAFLNYADAMTYARRQAVILDETIEQFIYDDHPEWTDFTNVTIGGAAGSITVSATNVDDICRAMLREIREASGQSLIERNGVFMVWQPANFEFLEAFMQANGFMTADSYLRNAGGTVYGLRYMGIDHYTSNLLRAGRMVGGIKKAIHLYLLNATYGKVQINDQDPNLQSGVSVVTRVDFEATVWNNLAPVVFDIAVS